MDLPILWLSLECADCLSHRRERLSCVPEKEKDENYAAIKESLYVLGFTFGCLKS